MADAHIPEVDQRGENLVENASCLFLRDRTFADDAIEELAIGTVLNEDVYFVVFADDLVDLGDVLMQQFLLHLDFSANGVNLPRGQML